MIKSTTDNIKNFQPSSPIEKRLSIKDLNRMLLNNPFICTERNDLLFTFHPMGRLWIKGQADAPLIYKYTLDHIDNKWYMTVSPLLLPSGGAMLVDIKQGSLTLTSTRNKEEKLEFYSHKHKII